MAFLSDRWSLIGRGSYIKQRHLGIIQAGPAKTLKTSQYRCAALIFSSSDLKFWHAIWTKLTKTTRRTRKNKNKSLTFHQLHDFGKLLAGHMSAIFFSFLVCRVLFWWAWSISRVKISGPNFIEKCMAKFPPKGLCIQIYMYFRDSSINFERKWPMKWNA